MSDATLILFFAIGSFALVLFAVFTIIYVVVNKRKHHQYLLEKQEMEHRKEQELMNSRLEVQEQTLKALSEELHDNIAPTLGLARMNLFEAGMRVDTKYKDMINTASEMVGNAVLDIRTLSHLMNGTFVLKRGLQQSIEKDVEQITRSKRIDCTFKVEGVPIEIGDDRELITYRIVQESINNAVRHGEPSVINISLTYIANGLTIEIKDNGKGFDTKSVDELKGLGLTNITARTEILNGRYNIISTKNQGTTVNLFIPQRDDR